MRGMKELLEIRENLKGYKPDFIRQDKHKRSRLSIKWRKPKGLHSKIRHQFKGRRVMPSPGYKSPKGVKELHSSGLRMVHVFSLQSLNNVNKDKEGIVIAKNVGDRARLIILKKAKEMGIKVLNLNSDEHIKKIEEAFNSRKTKSSDKAKSSKQKKDTKKEPETKNKGQAKRPWLKKREENRKGEPKDCMDEQNKAPEKLPQILEAKQSNND